MRDIRKALNTVKADNQKLRDELAAAGRRNQELWLQLDIERVESEKWRARFRTLYQQTEDAP